MRSLRVVVALAVVPCVVQCRLHDRRDTSERVASLAFVVSEARTHLGHSSARSPEGYLYHPDWYDGCVGKIVGTDEELLIWWRNDEITNYSYAFEKGRTYRITYVGGLENSVMGYKGKCLHVAKVRSITQVNPFSH